MSNEQLPPGTPPFWMVYFAVADTDATVAKAEELGGAVIAPAFDVPGGRADRRAHRSPGSGVLGDRTPSQS